MMAQQPPLSTTTKLPGTVAPRCSNVDNHN